MANLGINAANVAIDNTTQYTRVQFGEAVVQGQVVYTEPADGKYYKARATTVALAAARGIVVTPAPLNGYGLIVTSGNMNLGAALVVGETYVVSATAGLICPIADLVLGNVVTHLGVASSTSIIPVNVSRTGVAKA